MDPGLYGAQRAIQRHGDVLITQFLFVKQQKRLTVFCSDIGQRPLDFFAQMARGIVRGAVVGELLDQRAGVWPASTYRQQTAAAISSNRQQPRDKVSGAIPMRQAPQRPYKTLLRHIFGVLPVAQHAVAEAENLTLETFNKLDHGGLFARQATVN
jgi:hypothetical protein